MGNGWPEWPRVLFKVLGQCAAGATIVTGLGWISLKDNAEARQRLVKRMVFLWLLMGGGFLASILHLGSPLPLFNALHRIGASALSNDIASGALLFVVSGFWWLLTRPGKLPAALSQLSMLPGIIFVLAMIRSYQIETVPTGYNVGTTISLFLTMVLSGPLFVAL